MKIKDLKNMKEKPDFVTLVIMNGVYDIYQSYYWDETENDYVLNDGDIDELRIKEYSHLFRDFDEEKEILPIYVDYTRVKVRKTKEKKEIERLNNKEEQLIRRLEDLIIVGEQVENEWAVDICKMIIKELKGSDKE